MDWLGAGLLVIIVVSMVAVLVQLGKGGSNLPPPTGLA
jgi:hypothetical protein